MARRPDRTARQAGWALVVLGLVVIVVAVDLVTGEGGPRTFIDEGHVHSSVPRQTRSTGLLDGEAKWVMGGLCAGLGGAMVWGGRRLLRSREGRRPDGY